MEWKRVAAATLCCMLTMLPVVSASGQQQQVVGAGLPGFCGCFGVCYHGCREDRPRWLCTVSCVEACVIEQSHDVPSATAAAVFSSGDCSTICLANICGAAETSDGPTHAGAAAACVHDCTENWNT